MFSPSVAAIGLASPWNGLIDAASAAQGIDPNLVRAVIARESEWIEGAIGDDGASVGLMQVNARVRGLTPASILAPAANIPLGISILAEQLGRRPSTTLALAAYNAGTNRSDGDLQARIDGNVNGVGRYVTDISAYYDFYRAHGAAPDASPSPDAPPDQSGPTLDGMSLGVIALLVVLGLALVWSD